jgi:hypothetical protein
VKHYLLYLFLSISSLTLAQPRLRFLKSTNPYERIIYTGVQNYFSIEGLSVSPSSLKFITSLGSVGKDDKGNYYIYSSIAGPDTLQVYSGKKLLFSDVYESKIISEPIAILSNKKDSLILVAEILINPFLTVHLPNSNYKLCFQITSFAAVFDVLEIDNNTISTTGYYLSTEQLKIIKTLVPGNRIMFINIRANTPDGMTVKLSPFTVIIK